MDRAHYSPTNLARCTESLLDALSQAKSLCVQGELGERFADTLRFASDLLDVIQYEIGASPDPVAEAAVDYLARQVHTLRSAMRTAAN